MNGILGYWAGDTGDVELKQWLNETKHIKEWKTQVDPDESLMRSYQIEWTGEQSEKQLKSFRMQARGKGYACFNNEENYYSLYSMVHLKKIQNELAKQRSLMEKD